jgi:tRNA threonylcarbamoyladenosine modification (KEOPS) complex  Pcc1 subunit
MKEQQSSEGIYNGRTQIRPVQKGWNRVRMSHSTAAGNENNNDWRLSERMKEYISIEVKDAPNLCSRMQSRQDAKAVNYTRMSRAKDRGNIRNMIQKWFQWMKECKYIGETVLVSSYPGEREP